MVRMVYVGWGMPRLACIRKEIKGQELGTYIPHGLGKIPEGAGK